MTPARVSWLALAIPLLAGMSLTSCSGGSPIRTVEVDIHYSHFSPERFTFPAGTTVKFEIHNTDPIDHEFIVGNRSVQQYIETHAHPEHDGSIPGQISVPAETSAETTYTFRDPRTLLFACHLPGHFAYGMHGPIVVTG